MVLWEHVHGESPVVEFTVSLRHHNTVGRISVHFRGASMASLPIIAFTFPTPLSASHVACGCNGLLNLGVHLTIFSNCWVDWLVKLVPRSDDIVTTAPPPSAGDGTRPRNRGWQAASWLSSFTIILSVSLKVVSCGSGGTPGLRPSSAILPPRWFKMMFRLVKSISVDVID